MVYTKVLRQTRRFILAVAAVSLMPLGAAADNVTLTELEERAVRNQRDIANSQLRQASAVAEGARAGRKPTVSLEASGWVAPGGDFFRVQALDGSEVIVRASQPIGDNDAFLPNARYEATLAMRVPIYDFGRTRASIASADAALEAARAEAKVSRALIVASVRAHYLAWLEALTLHGLASQSAEEARKQSERVAARVEAGDRRKSDLDRSTRELLHAELLVEAALSRANAARQGIELVVGEAISADAASGVSIVDLPPTVAAGTPHDKTVALAKKSAAARLSAKSIRKARTPTLSATVATGINGQNDDVFPGYRAGLTFNIQLWDGGRSSAEAKRLNAQAAQLEAQSRISASSLKDAERRSRDELAHADKQLSLANRLQKVCEAGLDDANASYELGAGDLETVAAARAALRDARSRVVSLQVARMRAVWRLTQ